MIRHPNFNDRQSYSPALFAEELVRLRDLKAQIDEYGGLDRLRSDVLKLDHELGLVDGRYRWARPVVFNPNERAKK